jgi:hypothetical protein
MTMAEMLYSLADAAETIPYREAAKVASLHGLLTDFRVDYGGSHNWVCPETNEPIGVDVGELLVWLGY